MEVAVSIGLDGPALIYGEFRKGDTATPCPTKSHAETSLTWKNPADFLNTISDNKGISALGRCHQRSRPLKKSVGIISCCPKVSEHKAMQRSGLGADSGKGQYVVRGEGGDRRFVLSMKLMKGGEGTCGGHGVIGMILD